MHTFELFMCYLLWGAQVLPIFIGCSPFDYLTYGSSLCSLNVCMCICVYIYIYIWNICIFQILSQANLTTYILNGIFLMKK